MLVYRVADRDHERLVTELGIIAQFDSSRPTYNPPRRSLRSRLALPRPVRRPAAAL